MKDLSKLPPKDETSRHQEIIKEKKALYLEYYEQLPSQRLAAASIGRNEDTIILWKTHDSDFSEAIEIAGAKFALKNVKSVRSKEWLLERLIRRDFAPPQQKTDITSGGKPIPILGTTNGTIPENDRNIKDTEAEEEN